jgi:hypothetical protein
MKKKVVSTGKDYTDVKPIFKELVLRSGIGEGENLVFAGCAGGCYSSATNLAFGLRDLNLNLYFAADADTQNLWKLDYVENLGIVATQKAAPVKAKVIVLMSGLCKLPLDNIQKFADDVLSGDGAIIGQTGNPGMFERHGWDKKMRFNYLFESSTQNPTSYEISGVE